MEPELIECRIKEAIKAACEREMKWGTDDCVLWIADIWAPILGYDPVEQFRGRYKTKIGAYRLIGRRGLRTIITRMAIERAWAWIPTQRAGIGAISVLGHSSLLICRSPGWFLARAPRGFVMLPANKLHHQSWVPR